MNNEDEFITEFINDRIDRILVSIRKNNKDYKQAIDKYHELYDILLEQLTEQQQSMMDEMLSALNLVDSIEVEEVYKTAVKDYLGFLKLFEGK